MVTSRWGNAEVNDSDAPRSAQWVDEDDLEREMGDFRGNVLEQPTLGYLQESLSGIPLGVLRRAQLIGDSDSQSSSSDGEIESNHGATHVKDKHKAVPHKSRDAIAKRWNKHAPIEITSKKPVTRRRTVVEVKAVQSRDPRFLPLAGEYSTEKFQRHYCFLADTRESELKALREDLKRARKLLATSPRELFSERDQEVTKLELAVKRTESLVNKHHRDATEREALLKVTKDEREKRKQGKRDWWLKKADKRDLLVRARYEALAAEGGKQAVKKAIERKQKKVGQREKKSRPFPKEGIDNKKEHPLKRVWSVHGEEDRPSTGKKRRVGQ